VQQQPSPVIVRVVEQPVHETTISDVVFGSLGLVSVMLIAAAVLGLVLGGGLILFKRLRRRDELDAEHDAETLRVTPS
jgi:positive regulator of sigma E activity